jgi:hypothetical protein
MKRSIFVFGLLLTATFAFGQYGNQGHDHDQGRPSDHGETPWNYSSHPDWDKSWNNRPMPRSGACFFRDTNFQGDRFCVNQGDKLDKLPGNFGDNISSMQLYGKARVMVYNDRNFTGGNHEFKKPIADLRTQRFRDGHTWNDRISSLTVR